MQVDPTAISAALPGYHLQGEIGRGSFGIVLAAYHEKLQRHVAIKHLSSALSDKPAVAQRFAREARALADLDHPHVVSVFDFVERDGLLLLVMEYLPGGTLARRHSLHGLERTDACASVIAACSGVAHAHEHGTLHRDIKPENLLLAADGTVKVVDFGLARMVGGDDTLMTATGSVLGSPPFISPEQVAGEPLSTATDVYALATTLYLFLSGQFPFPIEGRNLAAVLLAKVDQRPTDVRDRAEVPDALADVVMQGLERNTSDRQPTAAALGEAIARAATAAYGEGWLTLSSFPVHATGSLATALAEAQVPRRLGAVPTGVPPGRVRLDETRELDDAELCGLMALPVTLALTNDAETERWSPIGRPMAEQVAVPLVVQVEIHEPDGAPRTVALAESTEFGRRCHGIDIADSEISRRHVEIMIEGGTATVRDLGSTNGSVLNGMPLTSPNALVAGDLIEIGRSRLEIVDLVVGSPSDQTAVLPGPTEAPTLYRF